MPGRRRRRRQWTAASIAPTVRLVMAAKDRAAACKRLGVSPSTAYRWARKLGVFNDRRKGPRPPRPVRRLRPLRVQVPDTFRQDMVAAFKPVSRDPVPSLAAPVIASLEMQVKLLRRALKLSGVDLHKVADRMLAGAGAEP